MKKWLVFILIGMVCFNITGCWNYREIDSLTIVAGVGIERDPKNSDLIIYLELILPSSSSQEHPSESKIIESRGSTMFDAIRNAIRISGKRLFWSHAQIIVISEDAARKGILDLIDFFYRDAEARLTSHLLVAQNASVKDILTSKSVTNQIRSFEIHEILKSQRSIEKYPKVEIYNLITMLKFDVPYAYLPSITIVKQMDSEVLEVFGTAIFKGDKLQGFLDSEETKYFLYIINEIKGGLLVKNNGQENLNNRISLEVFNNKTTLTPVFRNGRFMMEIHTETEASIAETGPKVNYADKSGLTAVTEDMQIFLQQNILRVIQKVQNDFDIDIFGFGQTIYRDMPDIWKQYKNNWDTEFMDLEFIVSSKIKIRNTATATKALNGVK